MNAHNIQEVLNEAKDKIEKSNQRRRKVYIPISRNIYEQMTDDEKELLKEKGYEFIEQNNLI